VTSIASGPNPMANLLDMVSMTSLTRRSIEDHWVKTTNGAAFRPWLQSSLALETNVWDIAVSAIEPAQVEELRNAINQWYARHPEIRSIAFIGPRDFSSLVKISPEEGAKRSSVFSLAGLDPMAGFDPAVREVTRTRLFAERAMFTLQRMPLLLRWQTELLTERVVAMPEVRLALTNTTRLGESVDRISRASEQVSQTAAQLPDRISAERKAILSALDQQESKLHALAAEVKLTLASGEKMSTSLNTTLITFDALMKRFGVGEPDTNPVANTNSPPFNILDYGKTAGDVGAAAKDLNTLVVSLNQSVPQVTRLSQQAASEVKGVVDRAFWLGLVLILILLSGCVLAGLTYRALAIKLTTAGGKPPAPNS
jgi:hypothetical protein